jgi:hypothetical protein
VRRDCRAERYGPASAVGPTPEGWRQRTDSQRFSATEARRRIWTGDGFDVRDKTDRTGAPTEGQHARVTEGRPMP